MINRILSLFVLFITILSCSTEPEYKSTGGETNWELEDYARIIFSPQDFHEVHFTPQFFEQFRPDPVYTILLSDTLDYDVLTNQLFVSLPEKPKLRCYELVSVDLGLTAPEERPPTAYYFTQEGGAGTEGYQLGSSSELKNEICFTGISEDQLLFQGFLSAAFRHDTTGPQIYQQLRPVEFKIEMAEFQVTLQRR